MLCRYVMDFHFLVMEKSLLRKSGHTDMTGSYCLHECKVNCGLRLVFMCVVLNNVYYDCHVVRFSRVFCLGCC